MNFFKILLCIFSLAILVSLCSCGDAVVNVNANLTITDNDTTNSTMNEKGEGTYERTFDRTVNGKKYTYYIYAANNDQYAPDKTKLESADISFTYNTTNQEFNIKAKPGTPFREDVGERLVNYITRYTTNYEEAIKMFDDKTKNYLEGNFEDDYDKEGFITGYNIPDKDVNTMVDGKGIIEKAYKKTVNKKPVQYYYYAASDDQYNPDKGIESHANILMFINANTGDIHVNSYGIDALNSDALTALLNEVLNECDDDWSKCWPLFEEKTTRFIETN